MPVKELECTKHFYGLKEKPFSILPDPDLIYWGRMHSMAFTMLEFGVMNNAGFTVITGEIGSGKTTLVRHLLKMLNPNITTGLISNSPQGREELLQWILMALGQPFEGNYPKLFKQLQDFLYGQFATSRRTILIIDEAQNLEAEALRTSQNVVQYQRRQISDPAGDFGGPTAAARSYCWIQSCINLPSEYPRIFISSRWMKTTLSNISIFDLTRLGQKTPFSANRPAPKSPGRAAAFPA